MQTTSAWLTTDPAVLERVSPSREELVDGLRAVTYLLHHLAPLFLMCDVRDLGSWLGDAPPPEAPATEAPAPRVLTAEGARTRLLRSERFEPTVYLYDNQPGGIGLTQRLFELMAALV